MQTQTETHQVMTLGEVAQMLRVSATTIQREIRTGGLPHVRLGRRILIDRDQLGLWLDQKTFGRIEPEN